jgi:foldase protein PrsA
MRLLRPIIFLSLACALVVVAGCGGSSKSSSGSSSKSVPKDAVAQVGGQPIPQTQFNQLLDQAKRSYAAQKRTFPKAGTQEYLTLRNQAMQYLVQRSEIAQKAAGLGIKVSDKQIADRLAQIKKQYFAGSETKYKAQLQKQGLTDQQVRDDVRAQLTSEQLFNKVTAGAKVSDADVTAYYKQHPQSYTQPQSRAVRHILVKDKALADKIYAQLKGGADFAKLAAKYSLDPGSKNQGGKLTITKGQTVPEFDTTAFSLKTNELSKPVKTRFGYHIIQALSSVRPRKTTPLKDVKEAIRQQLLQQKRTELMTKWTDALRKEYSSKIAYATGYSPPPTAATSPTTTR